MTTTFMNPVLDQNVADPTVWFDSGTYYLFYTGPFTSTIYKSTNMIDWENTGVCPFTKDTIDRLNQVADRYGSTHDIYAPTVKKIRDKWNIYISITWKCMCVLTSDTPVGPFEFTDTEVLIDNDITGLNITNEDSSIGVDGDRVFLFWGSHGKLYRTELDESGTHLKTKKFTRVAGLNCNPRKIYEGIYIHKHGDYWYLFAAKGNYTSATDPYEVVVGRSKTINGIYRNRWGLRMTWGGATNILKPDSTEIYLGGAHTGEIFTDKTGQDYIYYQRQRAHEMHFRPLFLQRIFWDSKGWPYFESHVTQMIDVKPIL